MLILRVQRRTPSQYAAGTCRVRLETSAIPRLQPSPAGLHAADSGLGTAPPSPQAPILKSPAAAAAAADVGVPAAEPYPVGVPGCEGGSLGILVPPVLAGRVWAPAAQPPLASPLAERLTPVVVSRRAGCCRGGCSGKATGVCGRPLAAPSPPPPASGVKGRLEVVAAGPLAASALRGSAAMGVRPPGMIPGPSGVAGTDALRWGSRPLTPPALCAPPPALRQLSGLAASPRAGRRTERPVLEAAAPPCCTWLLDSSQVVDSSSACPHSRLHASGLAGHGLGLAAGLGAAASCSASGARRCWKEVVLLGPRPLPPRLDCAGVGC